MSQQEFEPGSQSNQHSLNEDDEIQQPKYPYSWSGKLNQEGVPRDEPPSSYDPTVMQQGYQAQTSSNANAYTPGSSQSSSGGRYEYVAPEGDGDAYEQGYRPHNAYNRGQWQGVPPWARPQPHPRRPARFAFILLILLGVGFLMAMLGSAGPMMGDVLGTIMLVILFIIMVPIFILFVIFGVIFRMFRPRRVRYWRRGPWW